jgi:nucleoside-diphosphate-sugar epimerase
MKQIIIFLLMSNVLFTKDFFFSVKNGSQSTCLACVPPLQHGSIKENFWDYFYTISIKLPAFLNYALKNNMPVVFFLPENFHGLSPVDDNAYYVEGARVAMAWASAYQKVFGLDVKIIFLPDNFVFIENDFRKTFMYGRQKTYCCKNNNLKKGSFESEFIDINNFLCSAGENDLHLEPFHLEEDDKQSVSIKSNKAEKRDKKTVLITGVAGFIGSNLAIRLLNKGYQVIGLDSLFCSNGDNLSFLYKHADFEFHLVDVTCPYSIDSDIDLVVHLASIPSPSKYYTYPLETLATGLSGIKNALDIALQKNAKLIFTSSSEVYGDPIKNPQKETYPGHVNPWGMRSQYDESKRGGETFCKWYFEQFNLDIVIARIFNTYGPCMNLSDGRVITNFIEAALDHRPLLIHGSGNQTRSFAFVSDTVDALLKLIEHDLSYAKTIQQRIFNIGNDAEFTINELAQKIGVLTQKYLGYVPQFNYINHPDPSDPKIRKPDLSLIKKLNYNPTVCLDEGLEKTFMHFLQYKIN